jgi:hypothetical protein
MKRGLGLRWSAVALFGAVVAAALLYLVRIAPSGTGYISKTLCSGVFVSGRTAESVREEFRGLHPLIGLVRAEVDYVRREVSASLLGLGARKAVYRPGLGCTVTRLKEPPEELGAAPAIRGPPR